MKNLILVLAIYLPFLSIAQQEGTILFKETTNIKIELPANLGLTEEQMEKMMPSEIKADYVLHFNENESLYKLAPEAETKEPETTFGSEDSGFMIKMVMTQDENETYHNLKKNSMVDKRDFMGKTFLIKDEAEQYAWKLTAETKEILGYACNKATLEKEERTIEAWFTPSIPVATGPSSYYQLPGMILEITSKGENSQRHLIAADINFEKLDTGALVAPKKGKEVTQAEFDAIVDEKTEEMEESMGGKGIKIRVN